jgi:hypothetical protein
MRFTIFTTEAERQRARTRIVFTFFRVMFVVLVAFAAIVAGHYLLGWW